MNANELTQPAIPADEQVLNTVRAQQRWLRVLTALAVGFWALTVLGGVGVLVFYNVFYAPKEKTMLMQYETYGHLQDLPQRRAPGGENFPAMTAEKALGIHFTMNYAMTKGLLAIAVCVIVLSCGTLTTLLLVVVNRRVTLKQISYSLAQISEQLKKLEGRNG